MNSEVQNTHTRFPLSGFTQTCYCFFSHKYEPLPFFFSRPKQLISFMVIHVQHLASLCWICGNKIKDHMRKVDTNHFQFLKFTKSANIYYCCILQMFIHSFKKNQRKKTNFNCKWCISLLIERALIIWDRIKTLQVRQQAKKSPDAWCQHDTAQKKQTRKINKFELLFILVLLT